MILQAQDIIIDALGLVGSIAIDETPTDSDFTVCLRALNIMVDAWSAKRLMLRSTTTDIFTLTANLPTYTIGPSVISPNFNTAKPIKITSAFVRDSGSYDQTLEIISRETYDSYQDKNISIGRPSALMYDAGSTQQGTTGEISLYVIPDQNYELHIESEKYLTEFTAITDTVTFDAAYYEPLVYNLALRLYRRFREHDVAIPADIVAIANDSLRVIETMNSEKILASMETPTKLYSFNIITGESN